MSDSPTATDILGGSDGALDLSRPGVDLSSYRKARRPGELLRRALWECVQLPFYPLRPRR